MAARNILLILVHLFIALPANKADNVCFNCKQYDDPGSCKEFVPCEAGQECFHEVVEADDGSPKYSWGCASPQLCKLESNLSNRRKRLGIQRCFKCCDTNFCNYGGCTRDFCGSVTCQNNATCENTPIGHVCNCTRGYSGEFCENEIDECGSSPCINGNCTDKVGYYMCTCLAGYTGANCEVDIDECESNLCNNGAICIDQVDGFSCSCPPGITGRLCDIDINECASSPCQYNSTCTNLINGYTCDCLPGITGTNCEIDIDDCSNVICSNGGTCVDYINNFQCMCEFGFTGQYCETSLGRVCYSCENGTDDPINCTNKVICGPNEECYTEHELVSVGVSNYKLGCVPRGMCQYLQSNPGVRQKKTTPIQLCYQCCEQNGCNNHTCMDANSPHLWPDF